MRTDSRKAGFRHLTCSSETNRRMAGDVARLSSPLLDSGSRKTGPGVPDEEPDQRTRSPSPAAPQSQENPGEMVRRRYQDAGEPGPGGLGFEFGNASGGIGFSRNGHNFSQPSPLQMPSFRSLEVGLSSKKWFTRRSKDR